MPPTSPSGPWRTATRWFDRLVASHLRWIDAHSDLPPGRVDATVRCTVVYLVVAASLTLISYGVLNGRLQAGAARSLLEVLEGVSPSLREAARPYDGLADNIYWSLGCFTFYFVFPALIVRRVFGHRLRDYGLSTEGFLRHLWIYVLMFIPVGILVFLVAKNPDFQRQYPFYKHPVGLGDFFVWEGFYALQFFSLEFFFRGFMLHGVKDRLGRFAVFAMVVPYVMIHFRKPMFETVGAVIAGSVLGVLSLRTGSIWGGFLIHVAVAISMDVAAITIRGGLF